MKTIKCGVSCEYWNQNRKFNVEVDDHATEEEIEEAIEQAAIEVAGFEYWREDQE